MGKKRVQSSRQVRQVRQVRPRNAPVPPTPASQRKQREQQVRSGGLLQGHAPETVLRIGTIAGAAALGCVLVMVLILLLLPDGWPTRAVAAAVWLVPIGLGAAYILPGYQLARKDRTAEPKLVQGQLVGASEESPAIGLGVLVVQTRGGQEQYLVRPERLSRVPGNQVNVVLTMTPNLRHVRSVGIMGQRLVPRPPQPAAPPLMRWIRLFPIVSSAALAAAAILGADVAALIPVHPELAHAGTAFFSALLLAGIVFGASRLAQRRLESQARALMAGGLR